MQRVSSQDVCASNQFRHLTSVNYLTESTATESTTTVESTAVESVVVVEVFEFD
jgi:hypothetical protein